MMNNVKYLQKEWYWVTQPQEIRLLSKHLQEKSLSRWERPSPIDELCSRNARTSDAERDNLSSEEGKNKSFCPYASPSRRETFHECPRRRIYYRRSSVAHRWRSCRVLSRIIWIIGKGGQIGISSSSCGWFLHGYRCHLLIKKVDCLLVFVATVMARKQGEQQTKIEISVLGKKSRNTCRIYLTVLQFYVLMSICLVEPHMQWDAFNNYKNYGQFRGFR